MASGLRFAGFLFLGSVACGSPTAPSSDSSGLTTAIDSTETPSKSTRSATVTTPVAPSAKFACGVTPGTSRSEQVCWRWNCDGDGRSAATWGGAAPTCDPGGLDASAADNALRRINVHRFLADLEPFTQELAWTDAAQKCALIAHANGKLSHEPPRDWSCWSEVGAEISEGSLVANVSLAPSIEAYFEDPGNEPTMVHRRWLLDETLASVGFGSTDRYSCVVVDGKSVSKPTVKPANVRGWAAWPPAGPVPIDVFTSEKLDTGGWTIQSTKNDLAKASVKVSTDGKDMPVAVTSLTASLGSKSAIRFVPQGWVTEAGRTYAVAVTGVSDPIQFQVQPIACVE